MQTQRESLLIVGHGTRDDAGLEQFHALVAEIGARRPEQIVEAGFLELAEPTIAAALDRIVARGGRRIVVAPLLLFAAGHAQRDIPAAVAAAAQRRPGLEITQAPHLGCEPRIVELSAQRCHEAAPWFVDDSASSAYLLLVGRGSLDPDATAEMHAFADLRRQAMPAAAVGVCFAAMAAPTLKEGLQAAAASGAACVVVQPHLLFEGQLCNDIRRAVNEMSRRHTDQQWTIAGPLAGGPLLADAVLARAAEAAARP